MGGCRSGRFSGRTKVDRCKSIDISYLRRHGLLTAGRWCIFTWSVDGESIGSIQLFGNGATVQLAYRWSAYDESESLSYSVGLTYTACNYGRRRPWFLCPSCGKRVAKLYLVMKYAACRPCYGLIYQSQCEDRYGRAQLRAEKLVRRLGGSWPNFPDKPKGMHWKTYQRLENEFCHYSDEADGKVVGIVGRFLQRDDVF